MSSPGDIERRRTPGLIGLVIPVLVLAASMWVLEIVDALPGLDLDRYGIQPRSAEGLVGVVAAPVLHGGFDHLIANTGAFLLLGSLVAVTTRMFWPVTIGVTLLGGLATWLTAASNTNHIGASGLVYGFAAFLVAWGLLTRKVVNILVAVVVVIMYGGIVVGLLPGQPGISWQGHLFGAVAGVVMAYVMRQRHGTAAVARRV
ncbi:rhomboid family intramembrane serine protease [Actinobacteria bacterium YIM 96077]|uniref:Rhomboid family intramembrane serine protease n=1 Tax=Phytoactinopolyspora halophila TaxID=1981511 RepID=A0A329QJE1_9ACTN|nr:rhomboid family intramembrane serine protease [Phytoactinopolyspora halophila]AYY13515.1 rhomboid family intramembrane serine protease [Actinobacteria bacterium YIM 96077]RAW12430.1 rhomboid family intramembrane serine protease [Phytoactinopolyspora halophila]